MSALVKDFLGRRGKTGDLGIEVEVEGEGLPWEIEGWTTHREDTLQNGVEYVTSSPVAVDTKNKVLRSLTTALDKKKYKIKDPCPRASVHVHSNFLYNTPRQYWTSVCGYWLTENLLFNYSDPYRKGNAFCLRLADAEGVLKVVLKDLAQDYPFLNVGTDHIRYAGQNLCATVKYGTIEYRGLSFTLDQEKLETWTSELYNLNAKVNKAFTDPAHMMDTYLASDPKAFLSLLYGTSFVNTLCKTKGWQEDLERNEGIISEMAYAVSWDDWEKKINKSLREGVRTIPFNSRDALRARNVETIIADAQVGLGARPVRNLNTAWAVER